LPPEVDSWRRRIEPALPPLALITTVGIVVYFRRRAVRRRSRRSPD
jgi:hypothetical protein